MSGFNTKTPFMDWSSFMRRDFQKENGIGALANAFNVVADTADGYGETADKKLLSDLVNETDPTKIDNSAFYSKDNALKAKNIIETNKNLEYQEEQRNRANELNARNDAEYYIEQFNNEVLGDVWKYDKDEFFEKHGNSGGLNSAMMYDAYNKKEDRKLSLEDRNRKIEIDNLNLQNTRNSMARANEEYNYSKQQREQNKKDNDFLVAYESGYVPESELDSYRSSVSPAVFNGVMKQKKANDITNKYKTLDEFRNSEEWKTTPIEIKNEIFKSKIYEQPKSTYQEKLEQDLISDIGEMSAKLGTDNLANVDYATALADGKVTQNDLATYTYKLSRLPASKEVDKKMITGDFGVINQKANQFAKAAANPNLDTGAAENIIQQVTSYLPDWGINKDDLANQEFRSAFLGFGSILLKIQSGATVTDKEREAFFQALGTMSRNKKVNMVGILDKLGEAEARFEAVKSASPEYFNIKYGGQLNNLKKSKAEIENYLHKDNQPKPNEVKVIGNDLFKTQENISTGNKNSINTTNQNKILTPGEAEALGIRFP